MSPGEAAQLVRRELAGDASATDMLGLLRSDPHPFALIGAWAGGSAILGSEPVRQSCPPQPLAEVIDAPLPHAGQGAFGGGWVGYLGYGLAGELHALPAPPGPARRLPLWWFGYYDHVLRQEAATGKWFFEALVLPQRAVAVEQRYAELTRRLRALRSARPARPRPPWQPPGPRPARPYSCDDFVITPQADVHIAAVARAIGLIKQGDMSQVNLCLSAEAGFRGDPLELFRRGVSRLGPPYAAFVGAPGWSVASFSPELFLRRQGRTVTTSPIKGTCRRSADSRVAAAQRSGLERSAKNTAENVMIVDLMRNDLSRVCEPGTVVVPRLARAEPHPGVWHLVSDVRGRLAAGVTDGDLIRATFPPGSITGAPKIRAMEVIHELETGPREAYTGAIGHRSGYGLELSVAIRTFEFHSDKVWLGAGGGIVADSDPADEFRECLLKARPLVEAVGGTLGTAQAGPGHRAGPGRAPAGPPVRGRACRAPSPGTAPRPRAKAETSPGRHGPVILLIDNYDSFTYNLAHLLLADGADLEVIRNDEVPVSQVAALQPGGVVISPGPCTPAEAGISVDVIRQLGGGTPVLGVCLGHQAIAVAYGARIERTAPVHGKTSVIEHDGTGIFTGLPACFEATRYHSLLVAECTLPGCLRVTARAAGGLPMAIRHDSHPVDGVQFHPESILTGHGARLVTNFVRSVRSARQSPSSARRRVT